MVLADGKERFQIGARVTHRLFGGDLRVTRVKMFPDLPGREPEYELEDDSGQTYSDVEHPDLEPLSTTPVCMGWGKETRARVSPGWMYDAESGQQLGPASYEFRERFDKNGERPIEMVFGACKHKVVIR